MFKRICLSVFAQFFLVLTPLIFVQSLGSPAVATARPQYFAACTKGGGALPFPTWYKYLGSEGSGKDCKPKIFYDGDSANIGKTAAAILLAVIEIMTNIAGLMAAGFIIYGSFQYIMSQGSPEGIKNAKSTITNSVIGFILVILSIGIIQYIGRAIG